MPTKNNTLLNDDAFIADLIEERDRALARNRSLEQLAAVQEQDLQSASATIKALVDNAQKTIRWLQSESASMKQLITDAYNIHFCYGQNVSNEEWVNLSVSTLADMQRIALDHAYEQEQEKGGRS